MKLLITLARTLRIIRVLKKNVQWAQIFKSYQLLMIKSTNISTLSIDLLYPIIN